MANKKHFTVNTDNKTITIDPSVSATTFDKKAIEYYIGAGYKIRQKSELRANAARERAKKNGFGKKKETKEET